MSKIDMMRIFGLSSYINIGTQEKLSDYQNRHIHLTNIVSLAVMLACLAGIGLYFNGLFTHPKEVTLLQGLIPLAQMLVIFVVLHLMRVHKYDSARMLLVLSGIATILSIGLFFQPESGTSFFFVLAPLGIFLFLGLTSYAISLVFLAFIMMMGILTYQMYFPPIVPVSDILLSTSYIVSIVVVFVLVTLLTYFLIQTNQAMEKRLIRIMETDALTGLYNRLKYNSYIESSTEKAIQNNHPLSIIAIDIDFFKAYNDTYGHLKGDMALVAVANVLKKYGEEENVLATRFGGEEFAIILYNVDKQKSIGIAEEILEKVRALAMPHEKSLVADIVTCSAGVASVRPRGGEGLSDLFGKADQKLYEAKAQGRNRVTY